jgi:hypothetical protein
MTSPGEWCSGDVGPARLTAVTREASLSSSGQPRGTGTLSVSGGGSGTWAR